MDRLQAAKLRSQFAIAALKSGAPIAPPAHQPVAVGFKEGPVVNKTPKP